jgi:hypothetical protein
VYTDLAFAGLAMARMDTRLTIDVENFMMGAKKGRRLQRKTRNDF